jgi:hypothetical protein
VTEPTTAGWYRDPFGRYERRYHTGTGWTEHVKNRNKVGIDPPFATLSEVKAPVRVPSAPAARPRPAPAEGPRRTARPPRPSEPTRAAEPARAREPRRAPTPIRAPRPAAAVGAAAASPAPVVSSPLPRDGSIGVAPTARTLHKRPPSSYLKPAPAMVTPAPAEHHRPRWPWVVVSIFVLLGLALLSGVGIIDGSATEPRTAPPPLPKRASHTISPAAFDFVTVGTTRAKVLDGLDRLPAPRAEYKRWYPGAKVDPACVYYYAQPERGSYSFCFGQKSTLISKTAVKHRPRN